MPPVPAESAAEKVPLDPLVYVVSTESQVLPAPLAVPESPAHLASPVALVPRVTKACKVPRVHRVFRDHEVKLANPVSLVSLALRALQAKTDSPATRALLDHRVMLVPQVSQVLEGPQVCLVVLVYLVLREKGVWVEREASKENSV